jgi:hypothetical protein
MSLDRALAFYEALSSNASLREAYQEVCSELPELPYLGDEREVLRQWREEKILHFAANQGYDFGLGDLYLVWFGKEDYRCDRQESPGWRLRAIAALNRQMGKPIIPVNLEAGAA